MDSNWDLHKENVQPLPQGRKMDELGRFLTDKPDADETKQREATRKEFEDLLRGESNDKLAVWYDYINWVEQSYPEGGEDANLRKLIENCISDLFSNTKYHQDERFFRIFLRYTRIVSDTLELFNVMFNSNIFTMIAGFYINWANSIEKNLSKAEEIISMGLERLAQPTVQLELALKEIKLMSLHKESSDDEEEDVRKPFVPLKVEKKKSGKALAPVERFANYEQANYKLASSSNNNQQKNSQIQIFNDENGVSATGQQEIVVKLPTTNNQENQNKAGRWCDNRIKSKARLDQAPVAKFEIQEDEQTETNDAQTVANDARSRPAANKLKEIQKDDKQKSPRLVIFEKLAPNQRFYCDLKKIYCGGTEYSFEEIRSIRLKLAKKKEDRLSREELVRQVEELKKKLTAKGNFSNDVERMKHELERLSKQSTRFKVNGNDAMKRSSSDAAAANATGKHDPIENQCTREKQAKLDANLLSNRNDAVMINRFPKDHDDAQSNRRNEHVQPSLKLSPIHCDASLHEQQISPQLSKRNNKEDLTIVRDLWSGSFGDEQTVDIEREMIHKPQAGNFSIFKDNDEDGRQNVNSDQAIKSSQLFNQQNQYDLLNIQSNNFQSDQTHTFALPHGDFDFIAKHASTPASHYDEQQFRSSSTLDENCTINVFQQGRNPDKLLSPIVETSKEYKSSSSSSLLSGFSSYHKSKTFHK